MSFGNIVRTEAHSESSQTSKMDLLVKKVYGQKPLTIVASLNPHEPNLA